MFLGAICLQKKKLQEPITFMISSPSFLFKEYLWKMFQSLLHQPRSVLDNPVPWQPAVCVPHLVAPRLGNLQPRPRLQLELDATCSLMSAALMLLSCPQHVP